MCGIWFNTASHLSDTRVNGLSRSWRQSLTRLVGEIAGKVGVLVREIVGRVGNKGWRIERSRVISVNWKLSFGGVFSYVQAGMRERTLKWKGRRWRSKLRLKSRIFIGTPTRDGGACAECPTDAAHHLRVYTYLRPLLAPFPFCFLQVARVLLSHLLVYRNLPAFVLS